MMHSLSLLRIGFSNPAESKRINFWFPFSSSKSGYLILNPLVFTLDPVGKLILDNLERINDFPLLMPPKIPILRN